MRSLVYPVASASNHMVNIPRTLLMILLAAALATSGCHQARSTVTPVPFKYYQSGSSPSRTLLVLLPGIHDPVDRFDEHGFIGTVQQSEQPCDLVSVDAHYGYYEAGTIVERLHNDVIIPARQAGYTDIRIAGVSMGGLGALLYAKYYGTEVNALILLGPWLGSDELIDSITAAGSVENWQPSATVAEQPLQDIWLQRKQHASTTTDFPRFYLGYGATDKFRQAQALFAGTLPDDHIFTNAGGHNWTSWKQLWKQMQQQGILCE
jgi:pimeloyl-ACP methyl ester carboxylesterase